MGTSGRLDDGDMGDPEIRTGDMDDPEIRTGDMDDPDIRAGFDNPDTVPAAQPMSGGLPVIPIAIGVGVIVVAIAAFSILNGGSGLSPASSQGAGATAGATGGTVAPGPTGGGGGGPALDGTATLTVTGGPENANGSWTLDGNSADVSPTDQLIAGVWAEAISDVAAGYADIITLTIGGTIVEGTQTTSAAGVGLSFSISRTDAQGTDLFLHVFDSKAGECQVTMQRTSSGVSGTFTCTGITNGAGESANATGSFAT